jgi:hypothetical protein
MIYNRLKPVFLSNGNYLGSPFRVPIRRAQGKHGSGLKTEDAEFIEPVLIFSEVPKP